MDRQNFLKLGCLAPIGLMLSGKQYNVTLIYNGELKFSKSFYTRRKAWECFQSYSKRIVYGERMIERDYNQNRLTLAISRKNMISWVNFDIPKDIHCQSISASGTHVTLMGIA